MFRIIGIGSLALMLGLAVGYGFGVDAQHAAIQKAAASWRAVIQEIEDRLDKAKESVAEAKESVAAAEERLEVAKRTD